MFSCYIHNWSSRDSMCPLCVEYKTSTSGDSLKNNILKLNGVAAVNLSEPSKGDLERVTKAYQSALEEIEKAQAVNQTILKAIEQANERVNEYKVENHGLKKEIRSTNAEFVKLARENEKLRAENHKMREALQNVINRECFECRSFVNWLRKAPNQF